MRFDRLYAKSKKQDDPAQQLTLLEHTRDVCECAQALFEATGEAQLRAMGLPGAGWSERLKRELPLAALLHDLGKANTAFQEMVRKPEERITQPIRHEAVSYWIARRPAVREWLGKVVDDPGAIERLLWAVAGHHRKFPPDKPGSTDPVKVQLAHKDFRETVDWGSGWLGTEAFPGLEDAELTFVELEESPIEEIVDAGRDAREAFELLSGDRPEEVRYLALLKACLIASDVAGSVRRVGGRSMAEWLKEAFGNVPTVADLDGLVRKRLGEEGVLKPFQKKAGVATGRVVLVKAGCGSGKTLAAYHWAARTAERLGRGLRVFFCYPTTGTASEGYRDYMMEADLPAALVHGRAGVDMKLLGLGDDEPVGPNPKGEDIPGLATVDQGNSLDDWSTPLVGCTVDTVLGLVQNNRRGVYLWPSIAGAAIVFDEIHAFDEPLFDALVRFLKEVRGVHCLLMTASLPDVRRKRIEEALAANGEGLEVVPGPEGHEKIKRYRREDSGSEWERAERALGEGGKVLWVVNTVGEAMRRADEARMRGVEALIYHSRFRYGDRVERHRGVIEAFKRPGAALAISTQVSEMSLDLSADLLVTEIAPIPALIQRLGRLNRRAERDDPWPFVAYRARSNGPYKEEELAEAGEWLESLGREGLSQQDLVGAWEQKPEAARRVVDCAWLDGGFQTIPKPLRAGSPGMDVILREDVERVRLRRVRPEEVRIPMLLPHGVNWRSWDEVAHCKIAEPESIEYDVMRGAKWKTN
jgi:CRISPR-associated endonuclease/helicase Cas3